MNSDDPTDRNHLEENVRRLLARAEPDLTLPEASKARILSALTETATMTPSTAGGLIRKGRSMITSKTARYVAVSTAAAIVLLAIGFWPDDSRKGIAWANVAEGVAQIRTVAFRMRTTVSMEGLKTVVMEASAYQSSEHGARADMHQDGQLTMTSFMLPRERVSLMVCPKSKTYTQMALTEEQAEKMRAKEDPRAWLRAMMEGPYKELGRDELEGVAVAGIEAEGPAILGGMLEDAVARVWVDVATELPVRMEIEGTASGGKTQMKMVADEFQWDTPLDPALFEPAIPDDYTVQAMGTLPEATEATLIEALRSFADLTGGRYPTSLAYTTSMREMFEAYFAKHGVKLSEDGVLGQEALKTLKDLAVASTLLAQWHREGKEPVYYGSKVTAKDADAPLLRWDADDGQYKVLFGNLRVETVDSTRLKTLEERVSK